MILEVIDSKINLEMIKCFKFFMGAKIFVILGCKRCFMWFLGRRFRSSGWLWGFGYSV